MFYILEIGAMKNNYIWIKKDDWWGSELIYRIELLQSHDV